MKRFMAFATLCFLAIFAMGATTTKRIGRPQQTLGCDSLGTAAETTAVGTVDGSLSNFGFFAVTGSESVTVRVQLSYNHPGTSSCPTVWNNYGTLDTIPATQVDTVAVGNLAIRAPGLKYRLILDDIEATANSYFAVYERKVS